MLSLTALRSDKFWASNPTQLVQRVVNGEAYARCQDDDEYTTSNWIRFIFIGFEMLEASRCGQHATHE